MQKKRIVIILIILLILIFKVSATDGIDRQIGIVYLKNAVANYLLGQYASSEKFLERAEEFFRESSDLDYLKALIMFNRDNNLSGSIDMMINAVGFNDWLFLEKQDCIKDLSQLLLRTKRYDELIEIIEKEANIGYKDNDLMYIYLTALKFNKSKKYTNLLESSLRNYPKDYRFAELFLENNPSYANDIINEKYIFSNKAGSQALFLKAAIMLPDEIKRKEALQRYFSMGGRDPEAFIEYYKITGISTEEELNKLLKEDLFINPENIIKLEKILSLQKLKDLLTEYRNTYSGNIYYDLNNDGYNEELHIYEDGNPLGISIDNNQDGIIENIFVFEKGKPSEILIEDDGVVGIVYDNYPILKELNFLNGNKRIVFTLLQDSVNLDAYQINKEGKIIINYENIKKLLNDKNLLTAKSIKISTYKEDDQDDGIGLNQELERHTGKYSTLRVFDKIRGNYIYQNKDDEKTIGFADIDFDNLIDLKEEYKDGEIISIEVDDNKDGIYNYKLLIEEEGNTSFWDFNEDGIYDCKQYKIGNEIVSEYSSALDGNFDIIERSK